MERISRITFRGHTVIVADCTDCSPEELANIIDEVPQQVTKEAPGSVLLLGDFSRSVFTKDTVEHLKIAAVFDRPFVRRSAWVLTENLDKTLQEAIRRFSARAIPAFKTREEALEYLVTDGANALETQR
jgi:hypothetical protein